MAYIALTRAPMRLGPHGEKVRVMRIKYNETAIGEVEYPLKEDGPCIVRLKAKANTAALEKNPECVWRWVRITAQPATIKIAYAFVKNYIDHLLPHVHPMFVEHRTKAQRAKERKNNEAKKQGSGQ